MHPGCGQHPRPRDSDWAACQTRASPHTLAVRCGHDLGAPGPRGRHGVLAGPSSGSALPRAVRAQDCQHPPSPCASCIGPWQPKSTAGERGACRLCLQDRELARHSLLCHWRTRAARQACEVRGHPTPGTGKSVGCPGRHGGGTCSLSAGGEEQEALGGGALPLTTRRARGGPGCAGDPTARSSAVGSAHGTAASGPGSWSSALATGVLMDGSSATWGAAPAARAPGGPHAGLGTGSLPTARHIGPRCPRLGFRR